MIKRRKQTFTNKVVDKWFENQYFFSQQKISNGHLRIRMVKCTDFSLFNSRIKISLCYFPRSWYPNWKNCDSHWHWCGNRSRATTIIIIVQLYLHCTKIQDLKLLTRLNRIHKIWFPFLNVLSKAHHHNLRKTEKSIKS